MKTTCEQCGNTFLAANRRGITPSYCCAACRQKAYRIRRDWCPLPRPWSSQPRWARADGKRPIQSDGVAASSTDPGTWSAFSEVRRGAGDGYGVMLGGGLGCYDLDDVSDSEVREFLEGVDETVVFVERSLSGRGVHVFVETPEARGWRRGGIERYARDRFIRMTGKTLSL